MSTNDDRRSVIRQYFESRRRITEIERKALSKTGASKPKGPACSFCGRKESEVPMLIPGIDNAFVCSECIGSLENMLKGINDQ